MLTKDLLRFSRASGKVVPQFIKNNDPRLLELAEQLLLLYNPETQATRSELAEFSTSIINGCKQIKIAAGLNKIILDNCRFTCMLDYEFPKIRQEIFQEGTKILATPQMLSYTEYRRELLQNIELDEKLLDDIYADHPDNDCLIAVDLLSPQDLLNRYNLSLVQSLLLYVNNLEITIYERDQGKLRQFFKYLKFFRLLAEIKVANDNQSKFKITVSGPLNLFDNNRKYGLQLATFFPALLNISKWQMTAKILLNDWNYTHRLVLDNTVPIASVYHRFSSYLPEEIKVFHKVFKEKTNDWQVIGNSTFITGEKGEIIFPDLSFQHTDGTIVHLELFHQWHATAAEHRLQWLAQNKVSEKLIIGIEKHLLKDKSPLLEITAENKYFADYGFTFRDFPTITKIVNILEKIRTK